jgi:hypothetical protein
VNRLEEEMRYIRTKSILGKEQKESFQPFDRKLQKRLDQLQSQKDMIASQALSVKQPSQRQERSFDMEGGDEDEETPKASEAEADELEIPSDDEGGVEQDGLNESSIREKTSSRLS